MYIIIENIGSTIAKDIKITSNKPLKNSHGETFEDFKEIKSLPPKYDIKSYFDETYRYKNMIPPVISNFTYDPQIASNILDLILTIATVAMVYVTYKSVQ